MKIWNKWTWAKKVREDWIGAYGWLERWQELRTELENLGATPQLEQVRDLLSKDFAYHTNVPRCDECGKWDEEQEVIELGASIELGGILGDGYNRVNVCLPCLVKAMEMLDS